MPILDWLLRNNGVGCPIQGQWAELRWLRRPPVDFVHRLRTAVDLFPCELLFVHRDAEAQPFESRQREIVTAVTEAFAEELRPAWVCVVPVRMQEAWLLFDETAIRRAAGNPSGDAMLRLPALGQCENLPDPKELLHDLLREASELSPRRRARLRIGPIVRLVTEYTQDFAPLRALPAFNTLEQDLRDAIAGNRWDER